MKIRQSSSINNIIKISFILLASIFILIYFKATERLDLSIYDKILFVKNNTLSKDISIISLDDISVQQLGGFPSDSTQAKFIEKLFFLSPQAVIIEPKFGLSIQNKEILKEINKIHNVYIPFELSQEINVKENDIKFGVDKENIDRLIKNSGHFSLEVNNDNVIRAIKLNQKNDLQDINPAILNAYKQNAVIDKDTNQKLSKNEEIFIPFNTEKYQHISYIDVLKNNISPAYITGKYIILSQNLSSTIKLNTPNGLMPSADINAQALAGLIEKNYIVSINSSLKYILTSILILASILVVWVCLPKSALLINLMLIILSVFISIFLINNNLWFSPLPSILGIIFSYPMWIHSKMSRMNKFIDSELIILNKNEINFSEYQSHQNFSRDAFENRILALRHAISNTDDMRQFIYDNINSLPDAIIVTNLKGKIFLKNSSANQFLENLNIKNLNIPNILQNLASDNILQPKNQWQDILEQAQNNAQYWQKGVEIKLSKGNIKYALLRIVKSTNRVGNTVSWLWIFHDLTEKKQTEQQRDDMLRFLSHDMRAPQSSIIASIELHRKNSKYSPVEELLLKKIESHAYRTLTLAEEFVQLAKAETQTYDSQEVNMGNLVMDVVDDMWSLSQQKNIKLFQQLIDDAYVLGDRLLLTRCVTNLLSNAIKYTFENREIFIKLYIEHTNLVLDIIDDGPGISSENQKKLFERFVRFEQTQHIEGIGLGLTFVKIVIDKHNGQILCRSELGQGSTFSIVLPLAPPDITL